MEHGAEGKEIGAAAGGYKLFAEIDLSFRDWSHSLS